MKTVSLIGIYTIENQNNVHVLELLFRSSAEEVDLDQITQAIQDTDRLNWQAPYNECYLNELGNKVIGNYNTVPINCDYTRVAFFFHYLNFNEELITSHGNILLVQPTPIPDRLQKIMFYELP